MNNKTKKWNPLEPPRSAKEMICGLSVFHKMLVAACVSLAFLVIGFGLDSLATPEVPPFYGLFKTLTGIIRSGPHPLDEDRAIAFYQAEIGAEEIKSPVSVHFYARKTDCRSENLLVGLKVRLSLEEVKPGYRVRRAETMKGCLLYDDRLRSEIWVKKSRADRVGVLYFFVASFLALMVCLFYLWRYCFRS